jgi:hypothetical protein
MKKLLISLMFLALPCFAHDRTKDECNEAAEMIGHFADARDSGKVTKEQAIDQYNASIAQVIAVPPKMRWFIEDQDDVDVLGRGIEGVFDQPDKTPKELSDAFKHVCLKETEL